MMILVTRKSPGIDKARDKVAMPLMMMHRNLDDRARLCDTNRTLARSASEGHGGSLACASG